jgi:hypothetical protein
MSMPLDSTPSGLPPPGPDPVHRRLETIGEIDAAFDELLARAHREIRIFDHALARGFNGPSRHEALRAFLLASRVNRLFIVVHDPGPIEREQPRTMALLRQFAHAVTLHRTRPRARHVNDAIVLIDDQHHLHRFHFDQPRALLALDDPEGTRMLRKRFDEIWEASDPGLPPTRLGL